MRTEYHIWRYDLHGIKGKHVFFLFPMDILYSCQSPDNVTLPTACEASHSPMFQPKPRQREHYQVSAEHFGAISAVQISEGLLACLITRMTASSVEGWQCNSTSLAGDMGNLVLIHSRTHCTTRLMDRLFFHPSPRCKLTMFEAIDTVVARQRGGGATCPAAPSRA